MIAIENLARNRSSEGRKTFLDAVTELYLRQSDPSEVAKDHYAVIAGSSLAGMDVADRAAYSRRVAAAHTLPRPVARTLASDEVAVAHLVLKLSPVLTDEDLTSIASTHSQEHLIAIAERAALAEITSEVLADRGDCNVLRKLAANPGARLSRTSAERMLERSGADPQVSASLEERTRGARERQAQRVLRIATGVDRGEDPERGSGPRDVNALISDVLKKKRELCDVVATLARLNRAVDLALVLSTFTPFSMAHVLKVLFAPDTTAIGIVCNAAKLSGTAFEAVVALRAKRLKHDTRTAERELAGIQDAGVAA